MACPASTLFGTTALSVTARSSYDHSRAVATALAHAFLSADSWTKPALLAAGASVLGARRRWLGPLATVVLETFRSRPSDAPRELAEVVLGATPFARAIEVSIERGAPIRIIHHPTAPTLARTTGDRRTTERGTTDSATAASRLDSLANLAALLELTQGELDWFADPQLRNRRARPGRLHHYRYDWLRREGRTPRLLEVPGLRLRALQRTVLDDVLASIPLHSAAHGFVASRSAVTGAAVHAGRRWSSIST